MVIIGKAINDISYLRRRKVLAHFCKEKDHIKKMLKKNATILEHTRTHLFGQEFEEIIRNRVKIRKESAEIRKELSGPFSSKGRSPQPNTNRKNNMPLFPKGSTVVGTATVEPETPSKAI